MSNIHPPAKDAVQPGPIHLDVLRAVVFIAATLLFSAPLTGTAGCAGAVAASIVGVLLVRWLTAARVRAAALFGFAAVFVVTGLWGVPILGSADWLPRLLGTQTTMALLDFLTFGLVALGSVLALRTLAGLARFLSVLETGLVVGVVIVLFMGHRNGQIQQPMFLADWAWSNGYNPLHVYLVIGLGTLAGLILLLVQTRRSWKTAVVVPVLWALAILGVLLLQRFVPKDSTPAPTQVANNDAGDKPETPPSPQPPEGQQGQQGSQSPSDGDGPPRPLPPPKQKPQLDTRSRNPWPNKPKPVAVVTLHKDYEPVEQIYYFRMNAFSQLEGDRLVLAERRDVDTDVRRGLPSEPVEFPLPDATFELGRVSATVALIAKHDDMFPMINPISVEPCVNPNPAAFLSAYKTVSRVLMPLKQGGDSPKVPYEALIRANGGDPSWSEDVRRYYLAYPNDPRLKDLAQKIVAEQLGTKLKVPPQYRNSPYLRGQAVRLYIEENVTYALKADHSKAGDVASDVLFGDHRGHCVHVAYCMAYLLRSLGVPARVAGGYAFDAAKRRGSSSLLLTDTDGHAWCEIYLEGVGWVVVDASLKKSEDPPPPVVDSNLQSLYGELARGNNPDGSERKQNGRVRVLLAGLAVLPLLLLMVLFGIKCWRRLLPRFAAPAYLHRVCYRAVLDRLADVGITRKFGETREEFAARLAPVVPSLLPITTAHMRRVVGDAETLDRKQWLTLMSGTENALATNFSPVRRRLGLLNPVSWLFTR